MLSDSLLIFDRANQTLRLCVNAHVRGDASTAYDAAVGDFERCSICCANRASRSSALDRSRPHRSPARELHAGPVRRRSRTPRNSSAPATSSRSCSRSVLRAVRKVAPRSLPRAAHRQSVAYMFLLDAGDFALVGASPEVHVRLTDGRVEIRPIAGTARGATAAEDHALEKELLADEKERAEHLMLVDLARNDMGRVGRFGSVDRPRDSWSWSATHTSCTSCRRWRALGGGRDGPGRPHARHVPRRHRLRGAQDSRHARSLRRAEPPSAASTRAHSGASVTTAISIRASCCALRCSRTVISIFRRAPAWSPTRYLPRSTMRRSTKPRPSSRPSPSRLASASE